MRHKTGLLCPECGRIDTMKEHNVAEVKCYVCGAVGRVRIISENIVVPSVKRTTPIPGWDT